MTSLLIYTLCHILMRFLVTDHYCFPSLKLYQLKTNFIVRPPLLNELYEKTMSIRLKIERKIMVIEMKDGAIESAKHTCLLLSE